ncbi:MAG: acyl-CoA carboxylase subunit beta [Schleiferiaceae bacterium]|nr:acyl-CoA carboxylase subunit beta [Schleiferiaceae bacterium]
MVNKKSFEKLESLREEANQGGGEKRIKSQHDKGKLTARERLELLFDDGIFEEIGQLVTHRSTLFGLDKKRFLGDGVITGYGKVEGRLVYAYAQDFTILGGSLAEAHAEKICRIMDLALQNGVPIIGLNDSGGARIQEGVVSLGGYADIFFRNTKASGVIPQLSLILGPCAGGAVYSPALTDFIGMVEGSSYMFVTGPNVVKTVTHEEVTSEDLGGAQTHAVKSGVTHFSYKDEPSAIIGFKKLLSYLPQNCEDSVPFLNYDSGDEIRPDLDKIIPSSSEKSYDIRDVILGIVDSDSFFEVHRDFAENIVIGFSRIAGRSIGIIANQPLYLAGVLDNHASRKGARFVRFCDAFNIPLLVLEDVPGFLPGTDQEWNGIISNGAKLLYAFSEATVPRITVITRKAYGGAYDVMNSKHIGADMNYAWPSAEIAVMGSKGAAEIIFKNEISNSKDPESTWLNKEKEYALEFANPYKAASRGFVDEVIEPNATRIKLIKAFDILENKVVDPPKRKHGNIPL